MKQRVQPGRVQAHDLARVRPHDPPSARVRERPLQRQPQLLRAHARVRSVRRVYLNNVPVLPLVVAEVYLCNAKNMIKCKSS